MHYDVGSILLMIGSKKATAQLLHTWQNHSTITAYKLNKLDTPGEIKRKASQEAELKPLELPIRSHVYQ